MLGRDGGMSVGEGGVEVFECYLMKARLLDWEVSLERFQSGCRGSGSPRLKTHFYPRAFPDFI